MFALEIEFSNSSDTASRSDTHEMFGGCLGSDRGSLCLDIVEEQIVWLDCALVTILWPSRKAR